MPFACIMLLKYSLNLYNTTENEQDPMKADVKTVEFLLRYKQRDVEIIRRTHNLRRKEAEVRDIFMLLVSIF